MDEGIYIRQRYVYWAVEIYINGQGYIHWEAEVYIVGLGVILLDQGIVIGRVVPAESISKASHACPWDGNSDKTKNKDKDMGR